MTEEEALKLWYKVREVLVEYDIIKENGEATPGNEKVASQIRRIILVKSVKGKD